MPDSFTIFEPKVDILKLNHLSVSQPIRQEVYGRVRSESSIHMLGLYDISNVSPFFPIGRRSDKHNTEVKVTVRFTHVRLCLSLPPPPLSRFLSPSFFLSSHCLFHLFLTKHRSASLIP